ncbi:MAG: hypothetical protein HKM89_11355 [Gemmatimonadales bacterium]|nr:hypothetical protein [Gemmatimonadales bacterium]
MNQVPLQDFRRVAEALAQLRGQPILQAVMRSDFRQLRIELPDGLITVISVNLDESGHPRLEVDVVRQARDKGKQLEVRFEPSGQTA